MNKEPLKVLLKKHDKNIDDLINHLQITRQGLDDKIKKKRFKSMEIDSIASFLGEDKWIISKCLGIEAEMDFDSNSSEKSSSSQSKSENNPVYEITVQLKNLNDFYQKQLDKKDEQIIFYQQTINSLLGKQLVSGEPPLEELKPETKIVKLIPDYSFRNFSFGTTA